MLTALIVATALAGQSPKPPPRPSAVGVAPRPATTMAAGDSKAAAARLIARRRAKKRAAYVATTDREAREAIEAAKAAELARKEARDLLPYHLEARRQAIQRQGDIERNAALNRAVSAMERQAGYVYPGQSPTRGPY